MGRRLPPQSERPGCSRQSTCNSRFARQIVHVARSINSCLISWIASRWNQGGNRVGRLNIIGAGLRHSQILAGNRQRTVASGAGVRVKAKTHIHAADAALASGIDVQP